MGFEKVADLAPPALHARYRDQFPVTQNVIYLNHAAVSPLPRAVADAMRGLATDAEQYGSLHYSRWLEAYAGLRQAAARLINASPGEIAIMKNTSEGVSTIAEGLNWRNGDRVVGFQEEFPSNYFPWRRLQARGIEVNWLSIYDPLEKIAEAVRGARLLAISFVNYLSGYRVDLKRIGEICSQHGCFFFVDAIQGIGAFPIDVEDFHIDALASDGHKWMLGPEGNAVLYVRRKWLDAIAPTEFGWMNPASQGDYGSRDMTLRSDAGRYECGTLNTVGCFGLRAAIQFLLDVGVENVSAAVLDLANQLETGVRRQGYAVLGERTPESASGIVSFRHPSIDSRAVVNELERNGILAAPRQGWIRMSPHFYISPEEIKEVLRALPKA